MARLSLKQRLQKGAETEGGVHLYAFSVFGLALLLVVALVGLAALQPISGAVIVEGNVSVDGSTKKIQHPTGGTIKEIRVSEGQSVDAGSVLFLLDGTSVKSQLQAVEGNLAYLYVRKARLEAEGRGDADFSVSDYVSRLSGAKELMDTERALLLNRAASMEAAKMQRNAQIASLTAEVNGLKIQGEANEAQKASVSDELGIQQSLFSRKLVNSQRVTELERQLITYTAVEGSLLSKEAQAAGKISEIRQEVEQVLMERQAEISNEMAEVQAKILEGEERKATLVDQVNRLSIVSPTDGSVFQLNTHTINGVVAPGETLVTIVPRNSRLVVEGKLAMKDVDQVYVGQRVRLRFTALNQRFTPEAEGIVESIGADIVEDKERGLSYYPIKVGPLSGDGGKTIWPKTSPGMPVELFAATSSRSILSYLLKPVSDQIQHALREE